MTAFLAVHLSPIECARYKYLFPVGLYADYDNVYVYSYMYICMTEKVKGVLKYSFVSRITSMRK